MRHLGSQKGTRVTFIHRYLQKKAERKRLIAEVEAELFAAQLSRIMNAAFRIIEPASVFYNALTEKTDEEKSAELRLKYLKGQIKK